MLIIKSEAKFQLKGNENREAMCPPSKFRDPWIIDSMAGARERGEDEVYIQDETEN